MVVSDQPTQWLTMIDHLLNVFKIQAAQVAASHLYWFQHVSHRHDGGEGCCQSWLLLNGCTWKKVCTNDVPEFLGLSHPFLFLGTILYNPRISGSFFPTSWRTPPSCQAPRKKAPNCQSLWPWGRAESWTRRHGGRCVPSEGSTGIWCPRFPSLGDSNRKLLRLYWFFYWCLEKVVKIMGMGWGWNYNYIYIHVYIYVGETFLYYLTCSLIFIILKYENINLYFLYFPEASKRR